MRKVLLFTHKNDIDGMGSAVLARLAFTYVDYVLCETFELQKAIEEYFENGKIYTYDMIYIADLWLEEPMFSRLATDKRLSGKWIIFDHHKSSFALRDASLKNPEIVYFNSVLKIEDEKGLCCGTSLFFEYLIENHFLDKRSACNEFVELTRRHDTWEWKTKYNDEKSRELALLFEVLGPEGYINIMHKKLLLAGAGGKFVFDGMERMLIENKKKLVAEMVKKYADNMYIRDIMGLKAGIAYINYEYRNELGEYLREQKYDVDFVMIVALDRSTVSYRSVKDGVNVRKVAVAMGGKGHDKAATNPISEKQKLAILDVLLDESISALHEKKA